MRAMSANARYRPLLRWTLRSRSLGQTRKQTRVVASKSTLGLPTRPRPTRVRRNQGYMGGSLPMGAVGSGSQEFEKNGGRTGPAVGPQRVVRNFATALPALPRIEALGVTTGGIEHQQRLARPECLVL